MKKLTCHSLLNMIIGGVNFLISALAMTFLILAAYLLISDWGTTDEGFFLGWCLCIILFSIIVNLIIYTGSIGIKYQATKISCYTGNHLLILYQLGLLISLIAVLYLATIVMKMNRSFRQTLDDLESSSSYVSYDRYEEKLSEKFNDLYYSSASRCGDSTSQFFWNFVDNHCPEIMNSKNCQKCYDYEVTLCAVDELTCEEKYNPYSLLACPYELCREPILKYFTKYLKPLNAVLLLFAICEIVLICITCLSICSLPIPSNVRDSTPSVSRPVPRPEPLF